MLYTLPNGQVIELEKVSRISNIRDQGEDRASIGFSKMVFTIHLDNRDKIDVIEQYHFADWSDKKRKLGMLRADLIAKWKALSGEGGGK